MLALMATIGPTTRFEEELERLKRDYLPMWAVLAYGSAVGRGAPGDVPYADYMRPQVPWAYDPIEDPDPWVCNLIEAAIEEITPKCSLARAALSVRYVRNAQGPAVFRSGRIEQVAPGRLDDIADEAERLMVPVAKRRGLPL